MSARADPLRELVAWLTELRYEHLPEDVVSASKTYLLNTIAAVLAGSSAPGAAEIVAQAREWGGRAESTLAVHGGKVPAPLAALANGVMAHAVDFDDTQVGTGFHANVTIVPALLAMAEIAPRATGRDLIVAHAGALELACRMTLAATNRARHPWLTTTLFGVFGAAFAAGKLLALDETMLRHAVGIAYSSAAGNRQGLLDGTLIQRVQPGLCAQAAVSAVAFAMRGVTGAHDVLEGRYGLYPSYYAEDYEPATLTSGLGDKYRMLEIALKPFPCCSYSQEPIEAALEIVHTNRLRSEDVADIVVHVASAHAAGLVDHAYAPRSCAQVDAQFSLQYVIAAAVCKQRLGIGEFQEAALRDESVIELSRRVCVAVDPEREGSVDIRLKNGRAYSARVRIARGDPRRPFTRDELIAKLEDCAAYAAKPHSPAEMRSLADFVLNVDKQQRAAALAERLG